MHMFLRLLPLLLSIILFNVVNLTAQGQICPGFGQVKNPSSEADSPSAEKYSVTFRTDVVINGTESEPITMEVYRSWAPNSADRFYALMKDKYYDNATFFRVVPSFVVEFGIASTHCESSKWFTNVPADPIKPGVHNTAWTVAFAADFNATAMTVFTTQLFVNYANNTRLDAKGFVPFGIITSGFSTLTHLINPTPNSTDGIDQKPIYDFGNTWVYSNYNISAIEDAVLVEDGSSDHSSASTVSWAEYLALVVIAVVGAAVLFCVCKFDYVKENCFKSNKGLRDLEDDRHVEDRDDRF